MSHNFQIVNADTDSISFCKKDGKPFSEKEQTKLLAEINSQMHEGIIWDNDGCFPFFGIVGAKNYIMHDGKKLKIKGSALKATKKEPRLKKFINDVIDCIVNERTEEILSLYIDCAKEIQAINKKSEITPWVFKATATKAVLEPTTAFNGKVNDAILRNNVPLIEGDKYYLFFKNVSEIKEVEYVSQKGKNAGKKLKKKVKVQDLELTEFFDGNIDKMVLLKKLFVTIKIFNKVLDITKYPNYALKKHLKDLQTLIPTDPVPTHTPKNKSRKKRFKGSY